jgi:type IV fimbrial biogenesis protein FimT
MRKKKKSGGVTLIELLTVLAILTILLGVGVPSFQSLLQSQRLTTTTNGLFATVNLARSEAIQRGARVDLVPGGDGSDWKNGWVVFIDENADHKVNDQEKIVFTQGAVPPGIEITSNFSGNDIAYTGTGRSNANGSLFLEQGVQSRRTVTINLLGRARVCNPDTDDTCPTRSTP